MPHDICLWYGEVSQCFARGLPPDFDNCPNRELLCFCLFAAMGSSPPSQRDRIPPRLARWEGGPAVTLIDVELPTGWTRFEAEGCGLLACHIAGQDTESPRAHPQADDGDWPTGDATPVTVKGLDILESINAGMRRQHAAFRVSSASLSLWNTKLMTF